MTTELSTESQPRLRSLLQTEQIKKRFQEVLGKRASAFMSSIISAVAANKQLQECDPMSVIAAASIAATLDLPINPSLGFSHIVPYKNTATFQIGWKGFIQLAMRSGQYRTINITPVLEGQIKSHNPFTGDMEFTHESKSQTHIGYLLYFRLLNGYEKYFYMTKEECEFHAKRYSASYKKGFGQWADNFPAMALKTVAKLGLSKYGLLTLEMQKAVESDDAQIDDNGVPKYPDAVIPETKPAETTPSRLGKIVEGEVTTSEIPL